MFLKKCISIKWPLTLYFVQHPKPLWSTSTSQCGAAEQCLNHGLLNWHSSRLCRYPLRQLERSANLQIHGTYRSQRPIIRGARSVTKNQMYRELSQVIHQSYRDHTKSIIIFLVKRFWALLFLPPESESDSLIFKDVRNKNSASLRDSKSLIFPILLIRFWCFAKYAV